MPRSIIVDGILSIQSESQAVRHIAEVFEDHDEHCRICEEPERKIWHGAFWSTDTGFFSYGKRNPEIRF